jgi:hypothetical protein
MRFSIGSSVCTVGKYLNESDARKGAMSTFVTIDQPRKRQRTSSGWHNHTP